MSDGAGANAEYRTELAQIRSGDDPGSDADSATGRLNWGASSQVGVGRYFQRIGRVVGRFDVSSLQERAGTITSACLVLTLNTAEALGSVTAFPESAAMEVYPIADADRDWVEGSASSQEAAGGVCWDWCRLDAERWSGGRGGALTGETLSAPMASLPIEADLLQSGAVWRFEIADAGWMMDWVETPGTNAGFLIRAPALEGAAGDAWLVLQFYSDETAVAARRPRLEVQYGPSPAQGPVTGAWGAWLGVK